MQNTEKSILYGPSVIMEVAYIYEEFHRKHIEQNEMLSSSHLGLTVRFYRMFLYHIESWSSDVSIGNERRIRDNSCARHHENSFGQRKLCRPIYNVTMVDKVK